MSGFKKKMIISSVFFVFLLFSISAKTYYINWNVGKYFNNSNYVRYKINDSNWNYIENKSENLSSIVYKKNNTIYFEISDDNENWNESIEASLIVIDNDNKDNYYVSWEWNPVPSAKSVRYSIDGGDWQHIGSSKNNYKEDVLLDTLKVFAIQSSSDSISWFDKVEKGIIVALNKEIINPRKIQISIMGAAIYENVYMMETKNIIKSNLGYGVRLSFFLPTNRANGFSFDNNFSKYNLGDHNYLQYDSEIKYRFGIYDEKGIAPYLMIGSGASFIFRNNKTYVYPLISSDLGFDFWFNKQISLTINMHASASIQSDKYFNPNKFIDSISLNTSGSIGFSYAFCAKGDK